MLKEFGEFLVFILKGLGKLLLWLLVRLGLWVPLAFSLLFFLVLAITGTEYATVSGLFVFGLIVTTVLALVATITFAVRRRIKKLPENRNTQSKIVTKDNAKFVDKNDEMPVAVQSTILPMGDTVPLATEGNHYAPAVQPYPTVQGAPPVQPAFTVGGYPYGGQYNFQSYNTPYQPAPYPQPYNPAPVQQTGYSVPNGFDSATPVSQQQPSFNRDNIQRQGEQNAEFNRGIPNSENSRFGRDNGFSRDGFSRNGGFGRDGSSFGRDTFSRDGGFGRDSESMRIAPDEQPKIYRTRKDESVLIYEYSDRVEFYRKTESGLTFLYSEKKR